MQSDTSDYTQLSIDSQALTVQILHYVANNRLFRLYVYLKKQSLILQLCMFEAANDKLVKLLQVNG